MLYLDKILFVVFVENFQHVGPERFLPFKHGLFGDNVGCDLGFQTSLEKQMCQRFNIIVGVVIHYDCILLISQITLVNDKGRTSIVGQIGSQERSFSNFIPSSTVFSANSMTFEKYRSLVAFALKVYHVEEILVRQINNMYSNLLVAQIYFVKHFVTTYLGQFLQCE